MRGVLAAVLVVAACSSSANKHESAARTLLGRLRGTTVFGPASEFVPSGEVGITGMFGVRPPEECEIAILPGGEDSFAARMDLLQRAKQSIRIEALIFTGDESGLRVADVLKQKRSEGVDVKVVVDTVNNLGPQTQWMYYDLKQHGVEVEGYEAMGLHLVDELSMFSRENARHPNKRYHEKLWIIDAGTPNAEAVTGGLNIANEYFRVDPANVKRYWRDQDVLVRGAVVADLTATFDRNYDHFKAVDGFNEFVWQTARWLTNDAPPVAFERRDDLVQSVAAIEARPVARDYHGARCRFLQSRPRLDESFIQQAYLKLLDSAKQEVLIANAYFLPTVSLRMAIKAAAARCVRVVILSNGAETSDTPGMNPLARGYYAELLAANRPACRQGVEIWEWLGKEPGAVKQSQGLLHAKYAIVDREVSLVGSYNLDPRSERLNSESAIVFESDVLSAQLLGLYKRDLSTSRQISAKEAATFEKPATAKKRLEKDLAALFEDLL